MRLKTPRSILVEHAGIHEMLSKIIKSGGKAGAAAKEVAKALHPHFIKEEKYAMPELGVLGDLSKGKKLADKKVVINLSSKLEKALPEMLKEHKKIVAKLEVLKKAAKKEKTKEGLEFAKKLMLHAQQEEEVLYPASILVGKYLKNL